MSIETNYSMQNYKLARTPELKYVAALADIRRIRPGITGPKLISTFNKYIEKDPSDEYMSNQARESFLQDSFFALTIPSLSARDAVSILRNCDPHLETLVFSSIGHAANKFSSLVLGEYSLLLRTTPGYKLGDPPEENFNHNPLGRLLAIKAVFEKYLKYPRTTYPGWAELKSPHADYNRVKENFSQLLELHGLGRLSPDRIHTPPKLAPATPSAAEEAEAVRQKGDSPQEGSARRNFIQRRFQEMIASGSPGSEGRGSSQAAAITESPVDPIPAAGSRLTPVAIKVISPVGETDNKPTVDVSSPIRQRAHLVVTPAAIRALEAANKRTFSITPGGRIVVTMTK